MNRRIEVDVDPVSVGVLFVWALAWLVFAAFTGWIATQKGRSGCGWFLLGAIFGIFALIGIAIVPNKKTDI